MRCYFLVFSLLIITQITHAQKKICITVDDLPFVSYGINTEEHLNGLTQKLIDTFKAYDIPAIGYVNENKLYTGGSPNKVRVNLLDLWLANGYELGNHTYSHIDYHKTSFNVFTKDFLKGETIIKPMAEKHGLEVMYFRHPFLRAGETKERSDSLENFILRAGYTSAPVTVDSDDYLFAKAYANAFKEDNRALMQKIGKSYIDHTEAKLKFYESLTEAVFDRDIAQTYLMHANLLNADYLDELAEMFQRNGYSFVSQTEVLKDKAYQEPVTKFGKWGMSWLYRWALSKNKGTDLFEKDIEVPEFIKKLSSK